MSFLDFNFKSALQEAINSAGFIKPSPIQKESIPIITKGFDIVAQAQTGTGKTAAFSLPILNKIAPKNGVEMVVIVPTRELAIQVSDEIYKFGKNLGLNSATIYGGSSYERQIKHIKTASIVVATPGRLLDLLKSKKIKLNPKFVVLDEADEMLDMGFLEDIKKIFKHFSAKRQTLMFSATMPKPIIELSKTILNDPKFVKITKDNVTNENITQSFYVVKEHQRDDALIRLLDFFNPSKAIVFCRTKKEVDRVANFIAAIGYSAKGLHGDMGQKEREEVIKAFKNDKLEILVATDVAARGLDVNNISHVINFHLPYDNQSYVHRIGRTARGGKSGKAISIVTPSEFKALKNIQKNIGNKLEAKVIPTINDVYMRQKEQIKNDIIKQNISTLAKELINELATNLEYKDIALKLASILFSKNDIKNSDAIGLNMNQIQNLINSYQDKPKSNKRRKRNFNRKRK
jgi:ATP-dependent RNA helicase DeaD